MDGDELPESQGWTEREARICLARLADSGTDTEVCCFGHQGAWERALRFNPQASQITYESTKAEADELGVRIVTHGDDEWPQGLDDLKCHSPAVLALWVAGHPLSLRDPVCVTGARAATAYGLHVAEQMAHDLAAAGHTVVTSLSHGVDVAALQGALEADGAPPVVVMASGFADHVPPRLQSHEELVAALMRKGTVITERPPNAPMTRVAVYERTRILAAMSTATVVIEGTLRSSTRLVARWAGRDLRRHLLAVPGPVTSVQSQLPHELIATGMAQLVTGAADVMQLLSATTITDQMLADSTVNEGTQR